MAGLAVHETKGVVRMKTVVYAGTENLYGAMRIALTSLLVNNKIDRVYLLIEHDAFPYPLPDNVKVINVKDQTFFQPEGLNYKTRWRYMSLMRCALTKVFPHNKKVLWLDCDTIVDGDISDLFKIDMTGMYYGGVMEPDKSKGRTYINAGVLLVNLAEIRKDKFDDKIIEYLNKTPLALPDQDAINTLAQGKIITFDGRFNVTPFTVPTDRKVIYHYAANVYFFTEKMFIKYKGVDLWTLKH